MPIPPRWLQALAVAGCRSLAAVLALPAAAAQAAPNGTWLSQPQIWYYASRQSLSGVMAQIRANNYRVVFLDVRKVSDAMQQEAADAARQQGLLPVVWVQSPQYRRMRITDLVHEARHADGIQVDDHFFANYTLADFYQLRQLYTKPIFCSIQPFQAALVPRTRLQSTRRAVLRRPAVPELPQTGRSVRSRGEPLHREHHGAPQPAGRETLQHLPLARALGACCGKLVVDECRDAPVHP